MSGIELLFRDAIDKLVNHLSEKLDISTGTLNDAVQSYGKVHEKPKRVVIEEDDPKPVKASKVVEDKPKPAAKKSASGICSYTYARGTNKGQKCEKNATTEVDGVSFCTAHSKGSKGTAVKTEAARPTPKTKTGAKNLADEKSADFVNRVVKEKKVVVKNKWGNYTNVESNIVFEKGTGKAVGNQLPDGKVGPLTKKQMEECELNNWKFDPVKEEKLSSQIPKPPPAKAEEEDDEVEIEDIDIEDEEVDEEVDEVEDIDITEMSNLSDIDDDIDDFGELSD